MGKGIIYIRRWDEMKENKKEKIECYVVSIIMLFMPLLMFLHWLIIGY